MNLGQKFEETCLHHPDNVALIFEGQTITYRALNRSVNALAHHFQTLGIRKEDKVALMLPNCPEFVITYFAAQKIGAVAVTLNTLSTSHELRYLLENSDARIIVTQQHLAKRFEDIRTDLPLCQHLLTTDDIQRIGAEGSISIDTPDIALDDPAVMIYTAGLTGKPLGAVLTHRNLLMQATLLKVICNCTEQSRGLAVIPLFHSFGAVANMLGPLWVGASVVLMEDFIVDGIFKAIEKERVTYITGVPRLFMSMILHDKANQYDLSSLKFGITGGSAMPPEFIVTFKEKFGVLLVEGYGLTETSPICSVSRLNMPVKPGSIGIPVPGVRIRVVDEAGRDLPPGKIGELLIKGDNVMQGYYKDPERSAQVLRDGWLHTGDLGRLDEDGYLFLTGRMKRMVITSGFNVYPAEVETILEMHPFVQAARIESMPNLIRGEIVKARIVLKPGMPPDNQSIMKHCRQHLSTYKLPRKIEFVDKLEG
ncbi:MAG: AMP-binding protein [Smithellaceae bacterium]